jgi:hypothetical protein
MGQFTHIETVEVLEAIEKIQEEGLRKKIKIYQGLLDERGFNLPSQYMDKIEGYKNLFELRPHFHNIEFRMIFYWKGKEARFIHAFYERGNKKTNQREYKTADNIKKATERS